MERKDSAQTSNRQQSHSLQPTALFCMYEQTDVQYYRELQKYLHPWVRQQKIVWLEIGAGDVIGEAQERHLRHAELILLLLSPDFLASDTCYDAMLTALEEQQRRNVSVIPLLARTSAWKETECGECIPLPDEEHPIAHPYWSHHDDAYEQIRQGLSRAMPNLGRLTREPRPVASSLSRHPHRTSFFQARELSAAYVARPEVFERIKRLLMHTGSAQTTAITTALHGAGGFGKTTLALALSRDQDVRAVFPDGVFWIDLGEPPPLLWICSTVSCQLWETRRLKPKHWKKL